MYTNIFKESNRKTKEKFTGYVMSKDKEVAYIENDEVVRVDSILAPLYLIRTKDFNGWLKTRCIDIHRTNSRLLRKLLRLTSDKEEDIVLSVNASTITDTYWAKPVNSKLKYEDVIFKYNELGEVALKGFTNDLNYTNSRTPELTNIGSYEKCWSNINGDWYIIKMGSELELFSELFTYNLGKILSFNMASYFIKEKYIYSKDFTSGGSICFEPMYSIIGEDDDYINNIVILCKFNESILHQYMNIIFLDAIVKNVDRHTFNYGLLRDSNTGEILSLAPNFDNNLSLISRGYPTSVSRKDLLVKDFSVAYDYVRKKGIEYNIPYISSDIVNDAIDKTLKEINISVDRETIVNICINAYRNIINT